MPIGQWLVDRARDLGLRAGETRSRRDAETSLLWVTAATRLAPELAEGYWWQYDLAARLGRGEAALDRLDLYVSLQPDDIEARRLLIDSHAVQLQTVEQRLTLLRRELETAGDPELASHLHYRLAEIQYARGAMQKCAEHAEAAIEASPWHTPAIELLRAMLGDEPAPELELRWLLSLVGLRPHDPELLWRVASFLSDLSVYDRAAEWYGWAHSAFISTGGGSQVPHAFLLDWAGSALEGGSPRTALELCEQVSRTDAARGDACEAALERLQRPDAEPQPRPDRSDIRQLLAGFDTDILKFPRAPHEFLSLSGQPLKGAVAFGRPVRCTWTLTNNSKFPITLGSNAMVTPELLLSIRREEIAGVPSARADAYLTISLAPRRVLRPGESISITRALDVGPARQLLRRYPHRTCRFTFTAVLEPRIQEDGTWMWRHRAFASARVVVDRVALDPSVDGLRQLLDGLRSPQLGQRVDAVIALAGLIAEAKRDQAALNLQGRILDALEDPSWYVRARTLDALMGLKFDQSTIQRASARLGDPHWLVCMLAVDLFATRQGTLFRPVLQRMKRENPDVLVRHLAATCMLD